MINYEPLVTGDTVHGSLYVDPEVHAEEMDCIFTRGWVFVGHKSVPLCLSSSNFGLGGVPFELGPVS
jgi:hypothetical protein